jgi:rod shape-determining protein MreD
LKESPWLRIDVWIRHLVPAGVTILLLLLTAVPTRLPGFAQVAPLLPLMAVFYWAIYRPDLLPAWAAFAIGLLWDILAGTHIGVGALVLLLTQGVTASQRRFFLAKSFLFAWWVFALLSAAAVGLSWLLMAVLNGKASDPMPAMIGYLLTLGLFPPLTWMLARTQVAVLKEV